MSSARSRAKRSRENQRRLEESGAETTSGTRRRALGAERTSGRLEESERSGDNASERRSEKSGENEQRRRRANELRSEENRA